MGGRVSKLIRFTNGRNDLKGKHFRDYFHITTLKEHLALLKLLIKSIDKLYFKTFKNDLNFFDWKRHP